MPESTQPTVSGTCTTSGPLEPGPAIASASSISTMSPSDLLPLGFQRDMLAEVLAEDSGLFVAARGLGFAASTALAHFMVHMHTAHYCLVLVLATTNFDGASLCAACCCPSPLPPDATTSCASLSPEPRAAAYARGGVLFITPRMLVVDLLCSRLPVGMVTGVLIPRAERFHKSPAVSLLLRLLRAANPDAFIRAFSDVPAAFSASRLERTLKHLQLRKAFVWPRFHVAVSSTFAAAPCDTVELHVPMTAAMRDILLGLVTLINSSMPDLLRLPGFEDYAATAAVSESTAPGALFANLTSLPSSHLPGIPQRARALLADMRALRQLAFYLLSYDASSFLIFLETLYAACTPSSVFSWRESPWILTDTAACVMARARSRVKLATTTDTVSEIETHPKWHALASVLDEIQSYSTNDSAAKSIVDAQDDNRPTEIPNIERPTLIIMHDAQSACMLAQFLEGGEDACIRRSVRRHAAWKQSLRSATMVKTKRGATSMPTNTVSKRRRTRGDHNLVAEWLPPAADDDDEVNQTDDNLLPDLFSEVDETGSYGYPEFFTRPNESRRIAIRLIGESETADDILLHHMNPGFIILYEPDLAFVRRIELYRALHPGLPLRAYFMVYKDSTEEQAFLWQMRQEKDAVESIIKNAASVVFPLAVDARYQDQTRDTTPDFDDQESGSAPQNMRRYPKSRAAIPSVVVDVREFRAVLPGALHERGLRIVPCTLIVGDYVLRPDLVVERKSLPDLMQSLASGRLYEQAKAMCRHYANAVLLIEFEPPMPLSIFAYGSVAPGVARYSGRGPGHQAATASAEEPPVSDVVNKLVQLTIAFKRLRILWSDSAACSAEMLGGLKRENDEPDAAVAAAKGSADDEVDSRGYNSVPLAMLRVFSGLNEQCALSSAHGLAVELAPQYTCLRDLVRAAATGTVSGLGAVSTKNLKEFVTRDMQGKHPPPQNRTRKIIEYMEPADKTRRIT